MDDIKTFDINKFENKKENLNYSQEQEPLRKQPIKEDFQKHGAYDYQPATINNNMLDKPDSFLGPISPETTNKKLQILKDNANYAYGICIAGAVISLLIAVLGIVLNSKTVATISKFLISFGFVSMFIFLFGIYAVYRYVQYLNQEKDQEAADQSFERELLNLFIYFSIMLLVIFLILSIGCFAYKQEAHSYITALGQNSVEWQRVFGNLRYAEVDKNLNSIIVATGLFGFLMILLLITLLTLSYFILQSYRFIQTVVQFLCLIFFIIGALLLYISIYVDKYRDIVNMQASMPNWVPITLLISGIFTILIALGGYAALQQENSFYIKIFCGITGIFTIIVCLITIFAFLYSGKIKSFFDGNCKNIIDMLPQDFLIKYAGCTRKYVSTSNDLISNCPKERILLAWELNMDRIQNQNATITETPSPMYGCYDNLCCTSAYNTITSKSNYLSLIASFLIIIGAVSTLGSYKVYSDLEEGIERSGELNYFTHSNLLIYGLCGIVVLVILIALASLPEKPIKDPSIVPINPSNSTVVPTNLILTSNLTKETTYYTEVIKNDLKNSTKLEEQRNCGAKCPIIRYTFEMSSIDGVFQRNKTSDMRNLIISQDGKVGDKYVVRFEGDSSNINTFSQYYEFIHNCPLLPSSVDVKVTAIVNPPPTSFVQTNSKVLNKLKISATKQPTLSTNVNLNTLLNTHVIDYSKINIGDRLNVLDKKINYSFVTDEAQKIKGTVLKRVDMNTTVPIQDAMITIKSLDFAQCKPYSVTTDTNGIFYSPNLYVFDKGLKTNYLVTVTARDLTEFKQTVVAGGIGAPSIIDLGTIELWSPVMLEYASISSTVLNSILNEPISDVKVSLFSGYINLLNEIDTSNLAPKPTFFAEKGREEETNFIEMKTNQLNNFPVMKTAQTNEVGVYELKDLPPNQYSLVFEKSGYYREVIFIEVMGKMTKKIRSVSLTPVVEPGKIRIVLSWPDAPRDLDIYSIFKTGKFSSCQVYFGKKTCSGTHLDVDNNQGGRKGSETITIDILEKYIYTFAVRKYFDASENGLAPGEIRVEGAPLSADYNYAILPETDRPELLPNITLSESRAKVSVFISGFKAALREINVPVTPVGNLLYPNTDKDNKYYDWWLAFCLDGKAGLESLAIVNKLSSKNPKDTYCENLYNPSPRNTTFIEMGSSSLNKFETRRVEINIGGDKMSSKFRIRS